MYVVTVIFFHNNVSYSEISKYLLPEKKIAVVLISVFMLSFIFNKEFAANFFVCYYKASRQIIAAFPRVYCCIIEVSV